MTTTITTTQRVARKTATKQGAEQQPKNTTPRQLEPVKTTPVGDEPMDSTCKNLIRKDCNLAELTPMKSFLMGCPQSCQSVCQSVFKQSCKFTIFDNANMTCNLFDSDIQDLINNCSTEGILVPKLQHNCRRFMTHCSVRLALHISTQVSNFYSKAFYCRPHSGQNAKMDKRPLQLMRKSRRGKIANFSASSASVATIWNTMRMRKSARPSSRVVTFSCLAKHLLSKSVLT